jgi:hypothetical protein
MKNRDNLYADFCTYGGIKYYIGEFCVFNVPFFFLENEVDFQIKGVFPQCPLLDVYSEFN